MDYSILILTPLFSDLSCVLRVNLLVIVSYPSLVSLLGCESDFEGWSILLTWFNVVFPKSVFAMYHFVLVLAPILGL